MNNHTTARAPLRASETVDVLYQQIMGTIRRDGSGQFYAVETTFELIPVSGKTEEDTQEE